MLDSIERAVADVAAGKPVVVVDDEDRENEGDLIFAAELARYVAEKGSIAVDGVSLTVTRVGADWFEVGLIPETLRATVLGAKTAGDPVNLEVDVLAKYTERLLGYLALGVEGGR